MANEIWKLNLIDLFSNIIQKDNECEQYRQCLCINDLFVPKTLFNILDLGSKNYVNLHDFVFYLQTHQIPFNQESLRKVIRTFGKDEDLKLNYNNFLYLICPKYNSQIRLLSLNKTVTILNTFIPDASIDMFNHIIKKELESIEQMNQCSLQIQTPYFTVYEAFNHISKDTQYISKEAMKQFLNSKYQYSREEIDYLFMRLTSNNDEKMSYINFQQLFSISIYKDLPVYSNKQEKKSCSQKKAKENQKYSMLNNTITQGKNFSTVNKDTLINEVLVIDCYQNKQSSIYKQNKYFSSIKKKRSITDIKETLCAFLLLLIDNESKTEYFRESLCLQNDLNFIQFYSMLTIQSSNLVSAESISNILRQFAYFPLLDEIHLLFQRYDINKDHFLDLNEFLMMVKPFKKQYLLIFEERQLPSLAFANLSLKTKTIICDLFYSMIHSEKKIEEERLRMNSLPDFSSFEAFTLFSSKNKDKRFFNQVNLKDFLLENKIYLPEFQHDLLFNKLDKHKQGFVSFNDFILEILPHK